MSRLKELIDELCPDGVEYRNLKSLTVKPLAIKWADEDGARYYIDLASVDIASHNILETMEVDRDNAPSRARQIIKRGDVLFATTRPTQMRFCLIPDEYDDQLCSTGFCVLRANTETLDRHYLYHAIGASSFCSYVEANQTQGNYPAVSDAVLKEYRIPVPPTEVQREIVRVLDAMQELDDALDSELERRDEQLWQLRNRIYSDGRFEFKPLGSVGKFERGRRFTRAEMNGTGAGCVHYGDVYTGYKYFANEPLNRLDENIHKQLRFATKGDVIIATTSENTEDVCTAIAWLGDEDVAIHDDCQKFCHDQNPLYMAMFFNSGPFIRQKQRFITESKVVRVAGDEMAQIVIPLPPRDVQDRIAHAMLQSIDLMRMIEDERSARRKQFEHYRDRLLDFPEKAVS